MFARILESLASIFSSAKKEKPIQQKSLIVELGEEELKVVCSSSAADWEKESRIQDGIFDIEGNKIQVDINPLQNPLFPQITIKNLN